jgi:hypothetical protein
LCLLPSPPLFLLPAGTLLNCILALQIVFYGGGGRKKKADGKRGASANKKAA